MYLFFEGAHPGNFEANFRAQLDEVAPHRCCKTDRVSVVDGETGAVENSPHMDRPDKLKLFEMVRMVRLK